MPDTVLIVDDEDGVRRTFQEWLTGEPGITVRAAADAETALRIAHEHDIDLAILDWNLGSGNDGLQLLEDLVVFHPDLVAILVTGFAHQATPLDALRMGVRDYLDKNQDLTREAFLAAVRKQLARLQPLKRQRAANQSLSQFRKAVDQVLPLVKGSSALNDPTSLQTIASTLIALATRTPGASDACILVYLPKDDGLLLAKAYGTSGMELKPPTIPFEKTLAAGVVGRNEPVLVTKPQLSDETVLYPFEFQQPAILLATVPVGRGATVVLEVMGSDVLANADRVLVQLVARLAAEFVQKYLADHQAHTLLEVALEAANSATQTMTDVTPKLVEKMKVAIGHTGMVDADHTLEVIQAIRAVATRHGPLAVDYCTKLIRDLAILLDNASGVDSPP